MSRTVEIISLIVVDTLATSASVFVYLLIRFGGDFDIMGFLNPGAGKPIYPLVILVLHIPFWIVMLLLAGMYRERHASSRLDESVSLIKVVTVGVLILVFTMVIEDPNRTEACPSSQSTGLRSWD